MFLSKSISKISEYIELGEVQRERKSDQKRVFGSQEYVGFLGGDLYYILETQGLTYPYKMDLDDDVALHLSTWPSTSVWRSQFTKVSSPSFLPQTTLLNDLLFYTWKNHNKMDGTFSTCLDLLLNLINFGGACTACDMIHS